MNKKTQDKLKNAILVLLLPALLLLFNQSAEASSHFEGIVAEAGLLAEADTGTVLFDYNALKRHPADELTKIMTLLVAVAAIEDGEAEADDLVVMTESAWFNINANSSTRQIRPGEEMTLLNLMYSAYVGNANEACNMIAEHISGSVEAYIVRMNVLAASIGCNNTNFVNTHGQHNENQYTTARDQFLIFREAMSKPLFVEISGTYRYTLPETNASDARRLISNNSLLNQNGKYYYRHCLSGMSSITFEGGHSFVGMSESEGLSLITVILGSDEIMYEDESVDWRNLTEARRLFEWGYANFGMRQIISSTELVISVPVEHGAGADSINLRPVSSIELLLRNDISLDEFQRDIVIYSIENDETLTAPIEAGDVLGHVTITRFSEDGTVFEYDPILLVANTSIELHRFVYIQMQISDALSTPAVRNIAIILSIIVAAYIGLVIRYNIIRRKRISAIRKAKQKLREERQAHPPDEE